jgi:hypothetical protein
VVLRHPVLLLVSSLAALLVVAACTETDADDSQADDVSVEVEDFDPSAPPLDVASLAADSELGELDAVPYAETFVGEVTSDLFIGIALPGGAYTGQSDELKVYLCDGETIGLYLDGELGPDGATLEREGTMVELALDGNAFTGTVTLPDEDPLPFSAVAATADAGMYWAETTVDDVDYRANWIVLEDGRQRGLVCCLEWWCPIPGCWPR